MNTKGSNKIRIWGIESGRCMRVYWMAEELGLENFFLSISDTSDLSSAIVVGEGS